MIKFFFKFKKLFLVYFPNFWAKKSFSKKSSCHAQLHNDYYPEKSNDAIPRKHPDNLRKQGWTDPISWDPSSYHQGSRK